jgi:hypothetical protein
LLIDGTTNVTHAYFTLDYSAASQGGLFWKEAGAPRWQLYSDAPTDDLHIYNYSIGADSIIIDYTTSWIGIRVAAPAVPLHVSGAHVGGTGMLLLDGTIITDNAYFTVDYHSTKSGGIFFKESNAARWQLYATGATDDFHFYGYGVGADAIVIDYGTNNVGIKEGTPGANLHVTSSGAAIIGVIVEGAAAQSANLTEWRDSASGIHTIIDDDGVLGFQEDAAAPTAVANYGKIWTQADNVLYFQDGAGVTHPIGGSGLASFKSYNVTTQGLGAGVTIYAAGFYESSAADANLTQASTTVTFGSANISYAAHAFIVAGGAGVTDGSDLVLTVTGVSITDAGVRNAADSEVIVADCTAAALNQYFEGKKWLGQITFTLSSTGGTAFSFDFNYGLAKYEDFGNRDFTITDFEAVGYAGANEANLNVQLCHHAAAGWTYNAAAFVPGPAAIVQLSTDHSTDDQLASGEHFAYKRTGLSTAVSGSGSEGVLARITTTANNAIEYMNVHIGVEF